MNQSVSNDNNNRFQNAYQCRKMNRYVSNNNKNNNWKSVLKEKDELIQFQE